MFKTNNLIGRSIYETPDLICMEVVTKCDHFYITQFLVSKKTHKPNYDENWIDDVIEDSCLHITHEQVKEEIEIGLSQYFNVRSNLWFDK